MLAGVTAESLALSKGGDEIGKKDISSGCLQDNL